VGRIVSVELPHMPNFVAIGQTVVEISRFWIFQDGGSHHLGFLKFYIFNDRNGQERRTAPICQILSKSLKPCAAEICQFSIFQDGGGRHLGCWKFQIFNGRIGQEGRTASLRQNWGVWGFDPLNGGNVKNSPKRHIIGRVRVVWAIMRENSSTGMTYRRVPKKGINKNNFGYISSMCPEAPLGRICT